MNRLSHTHITSYRGNVIPLWLISDKDISKETIVWSAEGCSVTIKGFAGEGEDCISHGVLLTLTEEGESVVRAEYNSETFSCKVHVRAAQKATSKDTINYYVADLHIHTTNQHKREEFASRTTELPCELIRQMDEEGILDCAVLTDHAGPMGRREFVQCFVEEECVKHENVVIFSGAESSVVCMENDRFGLPRKHFGEIITLNANNFAVGISTMWEFYDIMADSPYGFGALVHPQIIGWDACGIWVSALRENVTPQLKAFIRLVEMGNGTDRNSNLINEYIYSVALDCGFRVAPYCGSDSHGSYTSCPGKTFLMAPGKSKELFMDAIHHCRVYACESGMVRLHFTVNGQGMAETLPLIHNYRFHIEIRLLQENEAAEPVICQVISDGGMIIKQMACAGQRTFEFDLETNSARYFYLRLIDREGRKTWSAPVWTGREFDDPDKKDGLCPVDKTTFTAYDTINQKSADVLINDNPRENYESGGRTASIVIDMKKEYEICGLGHIAPVLIRRALMEAGIVEADKLAEFVNRFRISASCDGNLFKECKNGIARVFGEEEIYTFPIMKARYVRFEALESVGKASGIRKYENATITIAELSIFTHT